MGRTWLWAVCLLACVAGCGGGSGSSQAVADPTQSTIVGRWAADTLQGPGGAAINCPTNVTVGGTTYACGLIDTQVFHPDGTYDEVSGGSRGTWAVNGNTLTVTQSGVPTVYTYSIQAGTLTEQLSTGGGPITLRFRRQ